jgi:tight adherence protein C
MDALASLEIGRTAVLVMVFFIVMAAALMVSSAVTSRLAVRRRLEHEFAPGGGAIAGQSLRRVDTQSTWIKLINGIEQTGLSLVDTNDERLRSRMIAAGYEGPAAPRVFTFIRLCMTLGLPAAYLTFSYMSGSMPSAFKLYMYAAVLALLGLYLPNLFIRVRSSRRRRELTNGFPDALDLMLVCVEAGLGLEAAFNRVGSEMAHSHPLLASMMGTVVLELRAGRSREDALRRMADRVSVDEIRSFCTLLIQSTKLGSSIAQTLRIYASEMREQRRLRAEEKAHRLPVLLSIPLVTCMLPVMIGVLMLPAIIRVIRQVVPAL